MEWCSMKSWLVPTVCSCDVEAVSLSGQVNGHSTGRTHGRQLSDDFCTNILSPFETEVFLRGAESDAQAKVTMREVVQQAATVPAARADEAARGKQVASQQRAPAGAQHQKWQPPQQQQVQPAAAAIDGGATAISSMRQLVDGAAAAISSMHLWRPAAEEPTGDDVPPTGDGVRFERRRQRRFGGASNNGGRNSSGRWSRWKLGAMPGQCRRSDSARSSRRESRAVPRTAEAAAAVIRAVRAMRRTEAAAAEEAATETARERRH